MKKIITYIVLILNINLLAHSGNTNNMIDDISFNQIIQLKDIPVDIIQKCKQKLIKYKDKIKKENEEQGIFDKKGCYIINSTKKCEDIVQKVEFYIKEDLLGYSDDSLRCKVKVNNKNEIELEKELYLIDIYGK